MPRNRWKSKFDTSTTPQTHSRRGRTKASLSTGIFRRITASVIILTFVVSSITPPRVARAQDVFVLPPVGQMIPLSLPYQPVTMKGIKIHPENPLMFDFIVDVGETQYNDTELKEESAKLIKYFLAALTVPEKDLWVNLSPYEKDRIIPDEFGTTEMGRDLLAQDYILKQLTASLIYPEDELGKRFWDRVYREAQEKFGTTEIPVNTFNKVWIVPEKAVVYENGDTAFVVASKLKVMLEQDYLALQEGTRDQRLETRAAQAAGEQSLKSQVSGLKSEEINEVGTQVIKEVILPAIEQEVNEGENFTALRQIYNAMILATWFKRNLKESLLGKVYVGQNKVEGVDIEDKGAREKIYQQYLKAFKKGVYNYIREEENPVTREPVARKYFSGGVGFDGKKIEEVYETTRNPGDLAMLGDKNGGAERLRRVSAGLNPEGEGVENKPFEVLKGGLEAPATTDGVDFTQEELDQIMQFLSNVKEGLARLQTTKDANGQVDAAAEEAFKINTRRQMTKLTRQGRRLFTIPLSERLIASPDLSSKVRYYLELARLRYDARSFLFTPDQLVRFAGGEQELSGEDLRNAARTLIGFKGKNGKPLFRRSDIISVFNARDLQAHVDWIPALMDFTREGEKSPLLPGSAIARIVTNRDAVAAKQVLFERLAGMKDEETGEYLFNGVQIGRVMGSSENAQEKTDFIEYLLAKTENEERVFTAASIATSIVAGGTFREKRERIEALEAVKDKDGRAVFGGSPISQILLYGGKFPEKLAEIKYLMTLTDDAGEMYFTGFQISLIVQKNESLGEKQALITAMTAQKDKSGNSLYTPHEIARIVGLSSSAAAKAALIGFLHQQNTREVPVFGGTDIFRITENLPNFPQEKVERVVNVLRRANAQPDVVRSWVLMPRAQADILKAWTDKEVNELAADERRARELLVLDAGTQLDTADISELADVYLSPADHEKFHQYVVAEETEDKAQLEGLLAKSEVTPEERDALVPQLLFSFSRDVRERTMQLLYAQFSPMKDFVDYLETVTDDKGDPLFNRAETQMILAATEDSAQMKDLVEYLREQRKPSGVALLDGTAIAQLIEQTRPFSRDRFATVKAIFAKAKLNEKKMINWLVEPEGISEMLKAWVETPYNDLDQAQRRNRAALLSLTESEIDKNDILALGEAYLRGQDLERFRSLVAQEKEADQARLRDLQQQGLPGEEVDALLRRLAVSFSRDARQQVYAYMYQALEKRIQRYEDKFGETATDKFFHMLNNYDWTRDNSGLSNFRRNYTLLFKYAHWLDLPIEVERVYDIIYQMGKKGFTDDEIDDYLINQKGFPQEMVVYARNVNTVKRVSFDTLEGDEINSLDKRQEGDSPNPYEDEYLDSIDEGTEEGKYYYSDEEVFGDDDAADRAMIGDDEMWAGLQEDLAKRDTDLYREGLEANRDRLFAIHDAAETWGRATRDRFKKELRAQTKAGKDTADLLSDILGHVFANAVDAVMVRIVEQNETAYAGAVDYEVSVTNEGVLVIRISDNGNGIGKDTLENFAEQRYTGGAKSTISIIAGSLFGDSPFFGGNALAMILVRDLIAKRRGTLSYAVSSQTQSGDRNEKVSGVHVVPVDSRTEQGTNIVFAVDLGLPAPEDGEARILISDQWAEERSGDYAMLGDKINFELPEENTEPAALPTAEPVAIGNYFLREDKALARIAELARAVNVYDRGRGLGPYQNLYTELEDILRDVLRGAGLEADAFELHLIDEHFPNATVNPFSRHIQINFGMVNLFNARGELDRDIIAAVLAHEVGHVLQQKDQLDSGEFTPEQILKEDDVKNRLEFFLNRYANEYDADIRGVQVMARAGYNAMSALKAMTAVREYAKYRQGDAEERFQLSHPPSLRRIEELRNFLETHYVDNLGVSSRPLAASAAAEVANRSHIADISNQAFRARSTQDILDVINKTENIRELIPALILVPLDFVKTPDERHQIVDAARKMAMRFANGDRFAEIINTHLLFAAFTAVDMTLDPEVRATKNFVWQQSGGLAAAETALIERLLSGREGLLTAENLKHFSRLYEDFADDSRWVPYVVQTSDYEERNMAKTATAADREKYENAVFRYRNFHHVFGIAVKYRNGHNLREVLTVMLGEMGIRGEFAPDRLPWDDFLDLAAAMSLHSDSWDTLGPVFREWLTRISPSQYRQLLERMDTLARGMSSDYIRSFGFLGLKRGPEFLPVFLDFIHTAQASGNKGHLETVRQMFRYMSSRATDWDPRIISRLMEHYLGLSADPAGVVARMAELNPDPAVRSNLFENLVEYVLERERVPVHDVLRMLEEMYAVQGREVERTKSEGKPVSRFYDDRLGVVFHAVISRAPLPEEWGRPSPKEPLRMGMESYKAVNTMILRLRNENGFTTPIDLDSLTLPMKFYLIHEFLAVKYFGEGFGLSRRGSNVHRDRKLIRDLPTLQMMNRLRIEALSRAPEPKPEWQSYSHLVGYIDLLLALGISVEQLPVFSSGGVDLSRAWIIPLGEFKPYDPMSDKELIYGDKPVLIRGQFGLKERIEEAEARLGKAQEEWEGRDIGFEDLLRPVLASELPFEEIVDRITAVMAAGPLRNYFLVEIWKHRFGVPAGPVREMGPEARERLAGDAAARAAALKIIPQLIRDEDLELMNLAKIARIMRFPSDLKKDDVAAYEQERGSYPGALFYLPGSTDANLDVLVGAVFRDDILRQLTGVDLVFAEKLGLITAYFPQKSVARDEYLAQMMNQTTDIGEILKIRALFDSPYWRDEAGIKVLEKEYSDNRAAFADFNYALERVLTYFPDASPVRNDLLNQLVEDHDEMTKDDLERVSGLMLLRVDGIKRDERARSYFLGADALDRLVRYLNTEQKSDLLLWLLDVKDEKPSFLQRYEFKLKVNFDQAKQRYFAQRGHFRYAGATARERFLRPFFDIERGLVSSRGARLTFVRAIFADMGIDLRKYGAFTDIIEAAIGLESDDPTNPEKWRGIQQRFMMNVANRWQDMSRIKTNLNEEERFAQMVGLLLEEGGVLGDKLAQFLENTKLVDISPTLRRVMGLAKEHGKRINRGTALSIINGLRTQEGEAPIERIRVLRNASIKNVFLVDEQEGGVSHRRVVKLKRPDIQTRIDTEMDYFEAVVNELRAKGRVSSVVSAEMVSQVQDNTRRELDFPNEVRNQREIAKYSKSMISLMAARVLGLTDRELSRVYRIPNATRVYENQMIIEEYTDELSLADLTVWQKIYAAGTGYEAVRAAMDSGDDNFLREAAGRAGLQSDEQGLTLFKELVRHTEDIFTSRNYTPAMLADAVNNLPAIRQGISRQLLKQLFVDGVYHLDPHGGNIFVSLNLIGGVNSFIDLGSVGRMSAANRLALGRVMRSFRGDGGIEAKLDAARVFTTRITSRNAWALAKPQIESVLRSNAGAVPALITVLEELSAASPETDKAAADLAQYRDVMRFYETAGYLFRGGTDRAVAENAEITRRDFLGRAGGTALALLMTCSGIGCGGGGGGGSQAEKPEKPDVEEPGPDRFQPEFQSRFYPPPNKTLLLIGQQKETIDGYVSATGKVPGGFMSYTSIQELDGLWDASTTINDRQHAQLQVDKYPNAVHQLGLYMVDALDDVLAGVYDDNIQKLADWIKQAGRPVYLRIGYEADLPGNNYDPEKYKQAFNYIASRLRDLYQADNAAFVWHAAAHADQTRPFTDWYPAEDNYVDYIAMSYFNPDQEEKGRALADFAKMVNKPFMIAESAPVGLPTAEEKAWWFESIFSFIKENDVRIWSYINDNWEELFYGKGLGDTRVETNEDIFDLWRSETSLDRYMQSSPELIPTLTEGGSDRAMFGEKMSDEELHAKILRDFAPQGTVYHRTWAGTVWQIAFESAGVMYPSWFANYVPEPGIARGIGVGKTNYDTPQVVMEFDVEKLVALGKRVTPDATGVVMAKVPLSALTDRSKKEMAEALEGLGATTQYPLDRQALAKVLGYADWDSMQSALSSVDRAMLEEDSSELVAGSSGLKNADYELSATSQEQIPGGIDLDPSRLEIETQGRGVDLNLPALDPQMLENMPINGFSPVIFSITPVTSLPLFLGAGEIDAPQFSRR